MLVQEVMTSPAVTVNADTATKAALRLLAMHRVTSMPVTDDDGALLGVVSEVDLLPDLVRKDPRTHMLPPQPPAERPNRVGDVMTTRTMTVAPDSDLSDAVEVMITTAVKSLPVVQAGRVVGVVSRSDVVRVLARADEQICADVDGLLRSAGIEADVDVNDGIVRVWAIADPTQARVAEVVAGSVTGVIAVSMAPKRPGCRADHSRSDQY